MDAVSVLDAKDIHKAYACGFSLGGMIAQHLAFDIPERTSGLIFGKGIEGAASGRNQYDYFQTAGVDRTLR